MFLGAAIINILNCLFGKKSHILLLQEGAFHHDETQDKGAGQDNKKKKKKKNKDVPDPILETDMSFVINVIQIESS